MEKLLQMGFELLPSSRDGYIRRKYSLAKGEARSSVLEFALALGIN